MSVFARATSLFSRAARTRAADEAARSRSRWVTLVFLAVLQLLIAVDVTVVNIALPAIRDSFHVDTRQLTWVVTGYTVVGGGLLMVGGRIADLFGRRRTLLFGAFLFGASSLAAGLAPNLELLVLARFGQGAGEALSLPAAMSLIACSSRTAPFQGVERLASVASVGLVLGFLLSGVITQLFSWRWIFLINIPLVSLVLVAVLLLVKKDETTARNPVDLPGALLFTAAPLLLIFGVNELGEDEPRLPLAVGSLLAAAVCAAAFVAVERRTAHPLVPLTFFGNRVRLVANGATVLLSAALSTSFFLLTMHLQEERDLSPIEAGLSFLPLGLSLILACVLVRGLIERIGTTGAAVLGMALAGPRHRLFALLPSDNSLLTSVFPGMILLLRMATGLVALQNAALHAVTEADAGVASGVQRCADQLGGASGIAVYVSIGFSPHLGGDWDPFTVAYSLAGIGLIAAVLAVLALSPDRRLAAPREQED
uniref:Lincomycin resistance protein n=1 Tax=Streptomyces lincolnensis TaxID=1915 RepID=LMRA_STRLN|nr:RecName: Full=Lincomycin resistance protein [Streptomyces lincolnensis]AAB23455.1 lincomycin-resistance determinant LmrA [Streptomyces lincolnensis, 78-11, Peptide, 481 aa] [Streptomyces lincolnensis]CAA42550.1 lincomycin resistance protein [Streptomyces lincolnensis]CAA55745.1 lmrA [Streptomyces lincolnensis]